MVISLESECLRIGAEPSFHFSAGVHRVRAPRRAVLTVGSIVLERRLSGLYVLFSPQHEVADLLFFWLVTVFVVMTGFLLQEPVGKRWLYLN